jgi:hypothetical protein
VELFHLVDEHFQVFLAPGVRRGAHLPAQLGKEFLLVDDFLPHLGQEGRPAESIPQDDAVHAGAEFGEQVFRPVVLERDRAGQDRDLDGEAVQLAFLNLGKR